MNARAIRKYLVLVQVLQSTEPLAHDNFFCALISFVKNRQLPWIISKEDLFVILKFYNYSKSKGT